MAKKSSRAFVKVDKYAPFDLRREYRLTGSQVWLLMTLALLANHRDQTWEGSLSDLADQTGQSRNTIPKAIDVLGDRGLVEMMMPFSQCAKGAVRVTVYDQLVVPKRSGDRAVIAQYSRSVRAELREGAPRFQTKQEHARYRGIEGDSSSIEESLSSGAFEDAPDDDEQDYADPLESVNELIERRKREAS